MKTGYRFAGLVAALFALAVLPAMAAGSSEQPSGRRIQPNGDLRAYFEVRGVEAQYLGKSQSEVPADQWQKMVAIVNGSDAATGEDNLGDVTDATVVSALAYDELCVATTSIGESVYMTIAGKTWTHTLTEDLLAAPSYNQGE